MAKFLHEVVRKREDNALSSTPRWMTQAYNELVREAENNYRRISLENRAQEAIDRYMSQATSNPTPGMTMVMPMLDINAPADASLATQNATYMFTGEATQGYRGWVRTN